MAGTDTQDWTNLPSLAVANVLSYLSIRNKVAAAGTCSAWRKLLFYPPLWRTTTISFIVGKRRRAIFLYENAWKFIRDLTIELDNRIEYSQDIDECIRFLSLLKDNQSLNSLTFRLTPAMFSFIRPGGEKRLQDKMLRLNDGEGNSIFMKVYESILDVCRNNKSVKKLRFGGSEDLYNRMVICVLEDLSYHQSNSLTSLHLQSTRTSYTQFSFTHASPVEPADIAPFRNLRVLGLEYIFLCNDLLMTFAENPESQLKRLVINVQFVEPETDIITDDTWNKLSSSQPKLRVTLNCIHANKNTLMQVFQNSIPLDRLRLLFSDVREQHWERLLAPYQNTLTSFTMMKQMVDGKPVSYSSGLWAWMGSHCKSLSHFHVIGVQVEMFSLMALAMKLGSQLKTLLLPDCCTAQIAQLGTPGERRTMRKLVGPISWRRFFTKMSEFLGREWSPLSNSEIPQEFFSLDEELPYTPGSVRYTEKLYHDILMKDQE